MTGWLDIATYVCAAGTFVMIGVAAYAFRDLRRAQEASSDWPSALQGDLPNVPVHPGGNTDA